MTTEGGTDPAGEGSARRFLVLIGCFIGLAVTVSAILMIPLGIYQKPVTAEFGWSRTQFSMVVALGGVCNAIMLPIAGFLVDRFGPRRVIVVGVTIAGSAYAALSQAASFSLFAGLVCVAVMAGTLAGYPAYLSLVERWFDKHLGLALSVASAGVATGVAASSWAITQIVESRGWREACLVVGCGALAIGLANVLLLIRDNPGPVPAAERTERTAEAYDTGFTLAGALRTTDFWIYTSSFTLVLFVTVGYTIQLPALLEDAGGSRVQIAGAVAMVSVGSLVGRLVTGTMLDRWPVRIVATIFYVGQAIGLLLLLTGLRWALPAAFLLGTIQGAEIDLLGFVMARRFGRVAYARIFGASFAITLIAVIASPVLTAQIYDRTGSYDLGLMTFPVLSFVALGLLWRARDAPEVPGKRTSA